jgi:PAS domain S-box-containing protein
MSMDIHKSILENLASGIICFDENGKILYINPTACKILHIKQENTIGNLYTDAFDIYPPLCNLIEEIIKNDKIILRDELAIIYSTIEIKIGFSSMIMTDENFKGYIIIFQDLSIIAKK